MAQATPQQKKSRVKSGTELFLRPNSPHLVHLERPCNTSVGSASSLSTGPGYRDKPWAGNRSARSTSPDSSRGSLEGTPRSQRRNANQLGIYDLVILGGTAEALSAATEAASCGAKVALIEPAELDQIGPFWQALKTCLRRAMAREPLGQITIEELAREKETILTRMRRARSDLVKHGVTLRTGSVVIPAQRPSTAEPPAAQVAGNHCVPFEGHIDRANRSPSPDFSQTVPIAPSRNLTSDHGRSNPSYNQTIPAFEINGVLADIAEHPEHLENPEHPEQPSSPLSAGHSSRGGSGRRLLDRSWGKSLPSEGSAYTECNGPYHPGITRGHRGTFWGMVPVDQALAKLDRGRLEWERTQRSSLYGGGNGSFINLMVEDEQGHRSGHCEGAHVLVALGETNSSLSPGNSTSSRFRIQGEEYCHCAEDLLTALSGGIAGQRVCILGSGVRALVFVAFCELAGAEVTWLPTPPGETPGVPPLGDEMDQEVAVELFQQLRRRGKVTVLDTFVPATVTAAASRTMERDPSPTRTPKESPRSSRKSATPTKTSPGETGASSGSESPVAAQKQPRREFYIQESGGKTPSCGPFNLVLVVQQPKPVLPPTLGALQGIEYALDGQIVVDNCGSACSKVSSIGASAVVRKTMPSGAAPGDAFASLCPDTIDAVEQQGRRAAQQLFGSNMQKPPPLAPPGGFVTVLSCPPVVVVGLTADEARRFFPTPEWSVDVAITRHEVPGIPGRAGRFSVAIVRTWPRLRMAEDRDAPGESPTSRAIPGGGRHERDIVLLDNMKVVGAAVIGASGGLQIVSGVAVGLSVAVDAGATASHFDTVLSAYTPIGNK